MKVIISPSKTLDLNNPSPTHLHSIPVFFEEIVCIDKVLKTKSANDLEKMMSISTNLANLNWERNQFRDFKMLNIEHAKQAIYTFQGEVYVGLDAASIPLEKLDQVQSKIRILSGLYGLLKPLDLILPYRLEMGIKIEIENKKNLYDFWKEKITAQLNTEIKNTEALVNLASKEYFSAIDFKQLAAKVYTPEFLDFKNGKLKTISFFAKKARGSMARFIIDNEIENIMDLRKFDTDGYRFDEKLSTEIKLVFTR